MKNFNYQGLKSSNYFEGWYFRVTDIKNNINLALIFAVTRYEKDPHAFIQIFDQVIQENTYIKMDETEFNFINNTVSIGKNTLSLNKVFLQYKDLIIDLNISNQDLLKKESAMGYLAKFPLECYQEVIYLDATVNGTITKNNETITIDGKGYMEKTYGKRFPKKWFWLQANHFSEPLAFTLAGGYVPTLLIKKFGFFVILHYKDKEYAFGTYNFAKCKINEIGEHVEFIITKGNFKLIILTRQKNPVVLVGPSDYGNMNLDVLESVESIFKLTFYEDKSLVFESESHYAGFEWMYQKKL
ncbi:tocopherol cyclase family protein [Liberiplasma polymorphum]|uniref:tocopherol cyclase family protein n=1 Tax=Liberiplasma polymorphum TaxID=3374570 RepID=UPI0037721C34